MQFIQHGFYENYVNASNYDQRTKELLLKDEIAKIIVFDRDNLLNALEKLNYSVDKNASNSQLRKIVEKNISDNGNLRYHVVMLILKNNKHKDKTVNFLSASGQDKSIDFDLKSMAESLDNSIYKCFNGTNGDMSKEVKAHEQNKNQMKKSFVNKRRIIVRTALITSAAWIAGYFLWRYMSNRRNNQVEYDKPIPRPPEANEGLEPQQAVNQPNLDSGASNEYE